MDNLQNEGMFFSANGKKRNHLKRRSVIKATVAALAASTMPKCSLARLTSYEPEDLRSTLTPYGAIRAGNAAGTIPSWTGGNSDVPPGYQQGDPRPVPFSDERPLFSISGVNAAQYQANLSAGLVVLMNKHNEFRIDIYPTHRTGIAPQYVYDNIYRNATSARLSVDGNSVTGAYGGIPFPIPKNGHEVMWNHLLAWEGTTVQYVSDSYSVTSTGELVLEARVKAWEQYYYYFENRDAKFDNIIYDALIVPIAPPYEAGGSILVHQTLNPDVTPVADWTYLIGERRVRRAPELQFDTPNSLSGGVTNWDEAYIFSGKLDEYDFQLVGKKELYVPYNVNKLWISSANDQFGPHFMNPNLIRWELHRVWVVEMTVKSGYRNVDARRTMYFDEDTGAAVISDVYDASGGLWKHELNTLVTLPDVPCVTAHKAYIAYDFHMGGYSAGDIPNVATKPSYMIVPRLPDSFFTPGQLAASSGGY